MRTILLSPYFVDSYTESRQSLGSAERLFLTKVILVQVFVHIFSSRGPHAILVFVRFFFADITPSITRNKGVGFFFVEEISSTEARL